MWDYGETLDHRASDAKLDRYLAIYETVGFGRWAAETHAGRFVGYMGVMPSRPAHPLGPHAEIGWRLMRSAWGNGYATEGAKAALRDVFARCGVAEVLAYTAPDNLRSRAVMERLGLRRDRTRDHAETTSRGIWHGLVWEATT
jgi:RimJ/RimL family protein N-acetyltransferase